MSMFCLDARFSVLDTGCLNPVHIIIQYRVSSIIRIDKDNYMIAETFDKEGTAKIINKTEYEGWFHLNR